MKINLKRTATSHLYAANVKQLLAFNCTNPSWLPALFLFPNPKCQITKTDLDLSGLFFSFHGFDGRWGVKETIHPISTGVTPDVYIGRGEENEIVTSS